MGADDVAAHAGGSASVEVSANRLGHFNGGTSIARDVVVLLAMSFELASFDPASFELV